METISHDGRETAYRLTRPDATGPTALYVHGSGGTHRVWTGQYDPSGPTHPAVALDLSGHGASDDIGTDAGSETLRAYGEDVCAVARETDADVLVGNSLGGAVVQHVLLDRSLSVEAAVLAGSGAMLAVGKPLRDALASDFERAIGMVHARNRLFHDVDTAYIEQSEAVMQSVGQAVTRRDFLTCHEFDVRHRLDEIEIPVLALVGEYDELTPLDNHKSLAERLPAGEFAVVEDAAHLAMVERPVRFNDAIEQFLTETGYETER